MNDQIVPVTTIDPLKYHTPKGACEHNIIAACGYLQSFVVSYKECQENHSLIEHVMGCYKFPVSPIEGFDEESKEILKYPEDEDMYPLVKIEMDNDKVFIYQHAIISFIDKDNNRIIYRMD